MFAWQNIQPDDLLNHLCRTVVLQISHACCKHQVSTKRMFYCSCFKQYYPFLLPNPNPLLNPLPVLIILLNPLPVLVVLNEDTPGNTLVHTLVDNKYSPTLGCLENSDRKVKQYSVLYLGLLQVILFTVRRYIDLIECVWFCIETPDLYRETVTQHTLR